MKRQYTKIHDFYVCNDCGESATSLDKVKHHKDCKPGESEKWQQFYNEVVEEND